MAPAAWITASRGIFYWQFAVDPAVVDRERADVVVQEVGERVLMFDYVPPNPAGVGVDFELRKRFRSGHARATLAAASYDLEDLERVTPAEDGGESAIVLRPSGPDPRLVFRPTLHETTLRLALELEGPTTLTISRAGEELLKRSLTLTREIVYAYVPDRVPKSEPLVIDFGTPSGDVRVRGLELRANW